MEDIPLEVISMSDEDITAIIEQMAAEEQWQGRCYDILDHNCNCFAKDVVFRLLGDQSHQKILELNSCGCSLNCQRTGSPKVIYSFCVCVFVCLCMCVCVLTVTPFEEKS